jgi:hypothetical protein
MSLAFAAERVPRRQPQRQPPARPERHLTVVPEETRRTVSYVVLLMVTVFAMMAIVIGFQAFIAEQQLKLDKVTTDLRLARLNYDELRQQRADLLAPDYLREKARLMGMSQGLGSRFMDVPADIVAEVVAATGTMDSTFADPVTSLNIQPGGLINSFQASVVKP